MPAATASKAVVSPAKARRPASTNAKGKDLRVLKREIATSVQELQSLEVEIAKVVRRMVSQTLDAAVSKLSRQDAVLVARDVGGLALEAVQQVLRGTAQGIEEVLKSHRATPRRSAAAKKSASRPSRSTAG